MAQPTSTLGLQPEGVKFLSSANGLPSNYIRDIEIGPQGFLWLSTAKGLARYDGVDLDNINGLNIDAVNHAGSGTLLTIGNSLWTTTDHRLWRLQKNGEWTSTLFPKHDTTAFKVNTFTKGQDGLLFIGTSESLLTFNPQTQHFKEKALNYNGQPVTNIHFIEFHGGWFWLSSGSGGIYVWDGYSDNVFSVTKSNPISDTIDASEVKAITWFESAFWLATNSGLRLLNNELRSVQTPQRINELKAVVTDIERHDNQLFIATEQGLYSYSNKQLAQLTQSPATGKIEFSNNGDLFLATSSSGLVEIPNSCAPGILKHYTVPNHLPDSIKSHLPESLKRTGSYTQTSDHQYWIQSDLGMVNYDFIKKEIITIAESPVSIENVADIEAYSDDIFLLTKTHQLYKYNTVESEWQRLDYGLNINDSFWLTRLGETLWLHSENNAYAINPFSEISERKKINPALPLKNASLAIDIKPSGGAAEAWFSLPFSRVGNTLTYRYKLDKNQTAWSYIQHSELPLQLNQPFPGTYQLTAQASLNGENWYAQNETSYSITHSFWTTPYAILGYSIVALLALGITIVLYRFKLKQLTNLTTSLNGQAKALQFSRSQYWQWNLSTGELLRQYIWPDCPAFPVDGRRLKSPESTSSNIHPGDVNRLQEAIDNHVNGQTEYYECSYRINNNGAWLWVLDQGRIEKQNGVDVMHGTLSDVSSLVSSQDRIDMLAASITNISDGICIFDRFFKKVEVNKAFERILGYPREQALGKSFHLDLYSEEFTNQIKRTVIKEGTWRGELTDIKADGSEFLMELTLDAVHDDEGALSFIVASFSDITERQRTESELRRLSNTDTLTGLPNRSYFQVSHSNLVRKKVSHTLLLFDLDDFKKVNDSLGHELGDDLLCLVAERLMDISRRQDTLYRLGGDEFGLLIEDSTDLHLIGDLAHKINRTIAEPYSVNNQDIVIGSSIGIVLFPHDGITSQELLQKADMAMYHAKQRGGNCYQFFSQSMNENAVQRLKLENQLRAALKNNGVEVYYQPKIEVHTGHIAGIESLARIKSDDGSQISPADFIPLAEETGLIIELGEQVLRQSCQDMKVFMQYPGAPKTVAINLSARQFMQSGLALQIECILRQESLPPRHVEFEITEGMVMSDPERAIIMMENLSDMGVKLALDDFGTGYSSLAYLKRFPMDSLKIDKAFIDDITTSSKDRSMVASIIGMAHNLGLKVIAEGVESEAQLEQLKSLECEYIQGFYYAKPMPADSFIEFIKQHTADVVDV